MNIEQIKVRREGREDEAWVKTRTGIETGGGEHVCVAPLGFKGRIINVPELEQFAIEAEAFLREITEYPGPFARDAGALLERFK